MLHGTKAIMGDCPLELIPLISKPKEFREATIQTLIGFDHRLRRLELMMGAAVSLSAIILGVLVKMVLGG